MDEKSTPVIGKKLLAGALAIGTRSLGNPPKALLNTHNKYCRGIGIGIGEVGTHNGGAGEFRRGEPGPRIDDGGTGCAART